MFSDIEFCEIFKDIFFTEHLCTTASVSLKLDSDGYTDVIFNKLRFITTRSLSSWASVYNLLVKRENYIFFEWFLHCSSFRLAVVENSLRAIS